MAKKIFDYCLIAVTVVATLMISVYGYYVTIGKNKLPSAVTSTYATLMLDPQTGERLPIIEANYYANKNGKGYEVVELLFNCYSGIDKQAIYSRGFQLIKFKTPFNESSDFMIQYHRYAGDSFVSGHDYEWGDPMIIDIDGKTYALKLDGTYDDGYWSVNPAKAVPGFFTSLFTDWGALGRKETYQEYHEDIKPYTFEDLLNHVAIKLTSASNGTGDHVLSLVDLGRYLHVYDVNSNDQIGEPLGVNTFQNSYFTMQTHYDKRGMVWAKQSIFGSVGGDSSFNISGIADTADYYKATTTYNLTEADFTAEYSAIDNGYYYSLPVGVINEIKSYKNLDVNITFDISNLQGQNVLGFDYYALYGIKVNSLTIKSKTRTDFVMQPYSLKDTGLKAVKTENVKLINYDSGVEL